MAGRDVAGWMKSAHFIVGVHCVEKTPGHRTLDSPIEIEAALPIERGACGKDD